MTFNPFVLRLVVIFRTILHFFNYLCNARLFFCVFLFSSAYLIYQISLETEHRELDCNANTHLLYTALFSPFNTFKLFCFALICIKMRVSYFKKIFKFDMRPLTMIVIGTNINQGRILLAYCKAIINQIWKGIIKLVKFDVKTLFLGAGKQLSVAINFVCLFFILFVDFLPLESFSSYVSKDIC